ncbi:hypothetical protein GGR50DRAFT_295518 [Xylaria sp. CBS 124048]|nr:hypothetical protein GGR50DRAFT_295518 [Xylaria sp. CBS 124048]
MDFSEYLNLDNQESSATIASLDPRLLSVDNVDNSGIPGSLGAPIASNAVNAVANPNVGVTDHFTYTPAFDPGSLEYNSNEVETYFHQNRTGRTEEFAAWRGYFFPNESRCDRCFIQRFNCAILDGSNECVGCALTMKECVSTNKPSNPPSYPPLPPAPPNPHFSTPPDFCNPPDLLPEASAQDPARFPDGRVPDELACRNCCEFGYPNCDMRHGLEYGCTACRKEDTECRFLEPGKFPRSLRPRPDGFLPPLCCDECVQTGIRSCSWRKVNHDSTLPCQTCVARGVPCTYMGVQVDAITGHHTHFTRTQHFSNIRPEHLQERFPNPQASILAPRVDGVWDESLGFLALKIMPNPPLINPNPPSPKVPSKRGHVHGTRRKQCRLCASYARAVDKHCDYEIIGDEKKPGPHCSQQGCTNCKILGLICVTEDGIVLPPRPTASLGRRTAFVWCDGCRKYDTLCDRQRPCDSCVQRNEPCVCTAGTANNRGTFTRGAGHGVELYTYMSMIGGGLLGVQDPNKLPSFCHQPADIHLQYIEWLAGGPLPVPLGITPTQESPPRPALQLRALPFAIPVQSPRYFPMRAAPVHDPVTGMSTLSRYPDPVPIFPQRVVVYDILNVGEPMQGHDKLPHLQTYQAVWNAARRRVDVCGMYLDLHNLRGDLRKAMDAGIPVDQVAAAQSYLDLSERPANARTVVIPPNSFPTEIALGLGTKWIFNLGQGLRFPPSPAPVSRLYDLSDTEDTKDTKDTKDTEDIVGDLDLPQNHHENVDRSLISREEIPYPNPSNTPALNTIPSVSLFDHPFRTQLRCPELVRKMRFCGKPTEKYCEDLSHDNRNPAAVCDDCDRKGRQRFGKSLATFALSMRAYACSECAVRHSINPDNYAGKQLNVWGLPLDAFASERDESSSKSRGAPLRITGCQCASKLLDRRLCNGHRLEHYLDIRTRVHSMRQYVTSKMGRMVCPFCLSRAGADAYNFLDELGVEFERHAYACLACYGIIVVDAVTQSAGVFDTVRQASGVVFRP